jgi:cell division protein FtsW (lipid II flippase)
MPMPDIPYRPRMIMGKSKDYWMRLARYQWHRRGHPIEIAALTQGLLIWPYFEFARLIAPLIDRRKYSQYAPEYLPLILTIMLMSLLVTMISVRTSSNGFRKWLKIAGIFIGILGPLSAPVQGIVIE